MIRVLYIGFAISVHDLKWISYFSERKDFKAFMLTQIEDEAMVNKSHSLAFAEKGIELIPAIHSYSIWNILKNRKSENAITEIIESRKIDIVHALFSTPFALWTRKITVPSVITTRGSDVHSVLHSLKFGSEKEKLVGKILLPKFKNAFAKANSITCTSSGQANKLNQILGYDLDCKVIRTGVNVDEISKLEPNFKFSTGLKGKCIIFLPRYIRPVYQTEIQLEAIKRLPENVKSTLGIVLVKGIWNEPEYQDHIDSLLAETKVPYQKLAFVSQHEMWSLFKLSALAIMTPKTDGTPNSALEAMAAKCPLILGSFNYDKDLFSEDVCHRMKTDSAQELSELIQSALENYPAEKLAKAFENVSKKGNRPVEMERLRKIYESLV